MRRLSTGIIFTSSSPNEFPLSLVSPIPENVDSFVYSD